MSEKKLRQLKRSIDDKGMHKYKELYEFSPERRKRQNQIDTLVMGMSSSVEASRIEQLLGNEKVEVTKPKPRNDAENFIESKVRRILNERFSK